MFTYLLTGLPSLISRTVSVDVKHHVYVLIYWAPVPYKPTVSVDVKQHSTKSVRS